MYPAKYCTPASTTPSSGVKMPTSFPGMNRASRKNTTANSRLSRVPYPRHRVARRGFPAPMFWATMAEMEALKELVGIVATRKILSRIPAAAEAFRPKRLMTPSRTMKEHMTRSSCIATGRPTRRRGRTSSFTRR